MNKKKKIAHGTLGAVIAVVFILSGAAGPVRSETLGVYGDWTAFRTVEGGKDVCYIGSEPDKTEGNYSKRGDTYMLVTHRPYLGELNVVSIRAGYQYKENSEISVVIDDVAHAMSALGEMAWARDADSDRALVKAMRKGYKMVVRGTSWRGTVTTDSYSLIGFTRAYKKSLSACGIK